VLASASHVEHQAPGMDEQRSYGWTVLVLDDRSAVGAGAAPPQ
jgi:hypothetical protein